jgi:purine nucleosidase
MSRRILIDTDAAADGIVGLVMALRDPSVDIAAVTTVAGKVSVEQATRNALTAIEYAARAKPPVYRGSSKPLYQDHVPFEKLAGKRVERFAG